MSLGYPLDMEPSPAERAILDRLLQLVSERAQFYETAVQTSACWRSASGWLHSLTRMDFGRKGQEPPATFEHEYANARIIRRLLSCDDLRALLEKLTGENQLDTGERFGSIPVQARLSFAGKTRWSHSEWSRWPADVFTFEPPNAQSWPSDEPLVAVNEPYYPSLQHLLSDCFGIRTQGWTDYLRGQVVIVLPDFRARISKLVIARTSLRAELECPFLGPADVVVKLFAENSIGRLAHETIRPQTNIVEVDLTDHPSFVSLALIAKGTGETLHEKSFQEGMRWRQPDVVVEDPKPEIEQFLLTGESETVEFKEKLDKRRPEKIAKTVAAFANTKGGTVIFGVNDEHDVVGCDVKGLTDTITNVIRSYCDPPPAFTISAATWEGKELVLVRVSEATSTVHLVKELGLFIRANGSNRAPTSHEFQLLLQQRGITESGLPFSAWRDLPPEV
jgi:Schlafen, AlbA_2